MPMGMSTRGNNVNILVLGIASFAYKVKNTISISKHGKGMKRGKMGPRVFVVGTQRGPPFASLNEFILLFLSTHSMEQYSLKLAM
jgi:hypothetical protein